MGLSYAAEKSLPGSSVRNMSHFCVGQQRLRRPHRKLVKLTHLIYVYDVYGIVIGIGIFLVSDIEVQTPTADSHGQAHAAKLLSIG